MAESLPPPYHLYDNATYEFCFVLPPKVNSAGIWENATNPFMIFSYSLPFLELHFVMIFLVNHLVYTILRSIGVKMDIKSAFRTTKRSLGIGIVSLLSPILVGAAVQVNFRQPNEPKQVKMERLIGTLIEALTSFSVIACLLAELKILNTELGRLALSSAAVALLFFVFRPLMYWVIKRTPNGGLVAEVYITATMMAAVGDALAFGLIMSSKGIVQLSHVCTFRDNKLISQKVFTAMIFCILANATIVPLLVRFLYDPDSRKYASYEQRNLMHLKPNVELRVLACVHSPDNVPAMICLLDLTCSTNESPNAVYVIHLIELRGRNSPVFIAHHNQETSTATSSFFENIISFYEYEGNNWDLVTVKAFTIITPPKLMHDDICTMALDKQTIQKLLKQSSSSSFSIGMLFLGGKDDREALTLARRMARDPRVKLTVIHLIAYQNCRNVVYWDTVLDTEMLKDVKQNNGELGNGCDVMYVEEVSDCGAQTIKLIMSIANDYDLMIVDRSYGVDSIILTGLSEWSEFPELGVVGDLFASTDLDSSLSVLVVQQQQRINVKRH
ncbi:cation/H(+) antiporter 15-like [Gossypium arboreum]|uniref:cation/H(+) antiporter 15-like n=1 Tax=Gossypium arboreum TaxID=29729 RepID=UPI0022F15AE0|nr:cation/H(+) antiporter 15-like [Gossypium arboreum]